MHLEKGEKKKRSTDTVVLMRKATCNFTELSRFTQGGNSFFLGVAWILGKKNQKPITNHWKARQMFEMKFHLCEEIILKKRLFAQEPDLALLKLKRKMWGHWNKNVWNIFSKDKIWMTLNTRNNTKSHMSEAQSDQVNVITGDLIFPIPRHVLLIL